MFNLGMPELLMIFFLILLIFGGKKIPEVAKGLGKGLREFKRAKDNMEEELSQEDKPQTKAAVPADKLPEIPRKLDLEAPIAATGK